MNPHGSPPRQTSPTPNLRKQLTFHDNTSTYILMKWHLRNEYRNSILTACVAGAGYWWHTQISVVLLILIVWSKFPMHHNQSEAIPRCGKQHVISMEFLHVVVSQNVGCFQWRIQEKGPGAPTPLPLFLDQTEAQRAEIFFCFRPPPPLPILGSGWPGPPLSEGQDLPLVSLVKPRPPMELHLWLSLSAKHCWNPCFGPLPVYQDLSMCHDWPV